MSKRELSFEPANWHPGAVGQVGAIPQKKKKKSRWGSDDKEKAFIPGMPTVIPNGLDEEQEKMYLLQLQIEEISRRLRTGDLGIPANPEDRSPSPEPIYNSEGKRLNTREYRTRKSLEEERHHLIQQTMRINTEYKPPADYKPPVIRVSDKVMIPQEEHPDINFVGLLIGPRGNTLKNLEKDTGAKIIIRGKGSVKEGKIGRKDGQPLPGEDEPLHAYVTASNPENVKKAVEKIKEIIHQGIEVPEGQNDLRRQQLRELALLNGTLRENDALGKLKQIQAAQNIITNTIICTVCGGTGHIAQDCKQKRPGDTFRAPQYAPAPSSVDKAKMDSEYMSLMAELGEGPPPPKRRSPAPQQQPPQQQQMGPPHGMNFGGHQQRPHFNSGPPMGSQPPQALAPPPWQGGPSQQQQQQRQQQQQQQMPQLKPPPMLPPSLQQPPPMMNQPPPSMASQVPPMIPSSQSNTSSGLPPWQASMAVTSVSNMPPLSAPPMPPVSSMSLPPPQNIMSPPNQQVQTSVAAYPWQQQQQFSQQQQQQQQQQQPMQMPPPPPPQMGQQPPPWQTSNVAPVPPPSSTAMHHQQNSSLPPWQQQQQQQQMQQQGGPPLPPSSYGNNAPPPPPPGMMNMSGLPMGVPPPPPPN